MADHIKVGDHYPITTIEYPDGDKQVVILHRHLQEYTIPIKFASLTTQLSGQTATMDGVYPSDVEEWLNGQGISD